MAKERKLYTFQVVRYVREEYSVEIEAESQPKRDEVEQNISDPSSVTVTRQTIKRVKP